MTTATVIGVPLRWKWVPVKPCDSCGEDRPADHRHAIPQEANHG